MFGKLPISIQQDLISHNNEDASPEERRTFLHRRQQNNQFAQTTIPQSFYHALI